MITNPSMGVFREEAQEMPRKAKFVQIQTVPLGGVSDIDRILRISNDSVMTTVRANKYESNS